MWSSKYTLLEKICYDHWKGKNMETGDIVHVRKFADGCYDDEGACHAGIRGTSIQKVLVHPNIVAILDVVSCTIEAGLRRRVISEYYPINLLQFTDELKAKGEPLRIECIQSLTFQLLRAVSFCHIRNILHRKINPRSILLDLRANGDDPILKLAGFRSARKCNQNPMTLEAGILWYRSPEILLGCDRYSASADIWSIGAILGELANMKPLFPGDCAINQLHRVFQALGTPTEDIWPGMTALPFYSSQWPQWKRPAPCMICPSLNPTALHLFSQLLAYDPSSRITARTAQSHPFFEDFDRAALYAQTKVPELKFPDLPVTNPPVENVNSEQAENAEMVDTPHADNTSPDKTNSEGADMMND